MENADLTWEPFHLRTAFQYGLSSQVKTPLYSCSISHRKDSHVSFNAFSYFLLKQITHYFSCSIAKTSFKGIITLTFFVVFLWLAQGNLRTLLFIYSWAVATWHILKYPDEVDVSTLKYNSEVFKVPRVFVLFCFFGFCMIWLEYPVTPFVRCFLLWSWRARCPREENQARMGQASWGEGVQNGSIGFRKERCRLEL